LFGRRVSLLLPGLLVLALFISCGCLAAKKQAPSDKPFPNRTRADETDPQKAQRIARDTDKVDRVQKSTVVVAGEKAYIGLDLEPGMQEEQLLEVENIVADRIKGTEESINTVYVSSDPDFVSRIKKIARGIARGDPVSRYDRELKELGSNIKPRSI